MSGLPAGVLQGVVVAVIGGMLVGIYGAWLAARRRKAYLAGRPASVDVFFRANVAPYPRRWRIGWLTVGYGPPSWKPRFGFTRPRMPLPTSATVDQIRPPKGIREGNLFNVETRIIVARAGDVNLEFAIPKRDIPVVLAALESDAGGAWNIPADRE